MKKVNFILLIVLLGCSPQRNETVSSAEDSSVSESHTASVPVIDFDNFRILPDDTLVVFPETDNFSDTLEANRIGTDSRVNRTSDGLQFKLRNGETKLIRDNKKTDGDDFVAYVYLNTFDEIHQWLVRASYYESFDYILIDQNDGSESHLWGYPVLSPDRKSFLTAMVDLEAGFVSNGFQLWSLQDKPVKLWEKELTEWGTDKVMWLNDREILAEQTYRDASGELATRLIKLRFMR
jgi:hypothetical protein